MVDDGLQFRHAQTHRQDIASTSTTPCYAAEATIDSNSVGQDRLCDRRRRRDHPARDALGSSGSAHWDAGIPHWR
jgi:hypothetical protein